MNLLYVALTRAKQYLFVSGCEPARGSDRGWYGVIEARLRTAAGRPDFDVHSAVDGTTRAGNHYGGIRFGDPPPYSTPPAAVADPEPLDPALTRPLPDSAGSETLRPSDPAANSAPAPPAGPEGAARGLALHRMLERLADGAPRASLKRALREALGAGLAPADFDSGFDEACAVIDNPHFRAWFDPRRYRSAHNELPLLFRAGEHEIYGVIDRLVVGDHEIAVLDYKTHAGIDANNVLPLAEQYREQLEMYMQGAGQLWPDREVRGWLIFTAAGMALELVGDRPGNRRFRMLSPDT